MFLGVVVGVAVVVRGGGFDADWLIKSGRLWEYYNEIR